MKAAGNQIYYFGDLDYEGIGIYENLSADFGEKWNIVPFEAGYRKMLSKAKGVDSIPETKEGQNRNIKDIFFSLVSASSLRLISGIRSVFPVIVLYRPNDSLIGRRLCI